MIINLNAVLCLLVRENFLNQWVETCNVLINGHTSRTSTRRWAQGKWWIKLAMTQCFASSTAINDRSKKDQNFNVWIKTYHNVPNRWLEFDLSIKACRPPQASCSLAFSIQLTQQIQAIAALVVLLDDGNVNKTIFSGCFPQCVIETRPSYKWFVINYAIGSLVTTIALENLFFSNRTKHERN